jgi:hypothetical protein
MKSIVIPVFVLLLCLVETIAALSFQITISEFTSFRNGYRIEMKAADVNNFILTIKCENCDKHYALYNSVSISDGENMWNTDKCTIAFCVQSLPPPSEFEFKTVSKKDWVDGISFRVRLPFNKSAVLYLYTRHVFKYNILPTFLVIKKARFPKNVVFHSYGQVVHVQAYSTDSKSRTVTVNDYPFWVMEAAKIALEAYKIVIPQEIPRLDGFRTLFQFAGDYDFIAIQKIILSRIVFEVTHDRFTDFLAILSKLKEDRFCLVERMFDTLAAHYCQNMNTMSLANIVHEVQLKLSCDL